MEIKQLNNLYLNLSRSYKINDDLLIEITKSIGSNNKGLKKLTISLCNPITYF